MAEETRPAARPRISNELIGMLAIGVALAGLILATSNDLRAEIRYQISELRTEMRGAIDRLDDRAVEIRLGKVEIRLDQVEICLGKVETRLGGVEIRLGKVETRLGMADAQAASAGQPADARERTAALGMAQPGGPGADVRTDGIRALP